MGTTYDAAGTIKPEVNAVPNTLSEADLDGDTMESPPIDHSSGRYDRRGVTECALSIILPTYNEAKNLPEIVGLLSDVLLDTDYEIIVVDDDSPDRTWEIAGQLAAANGRIQSLRRIGERGLSSAVLAGMHLSRGHVLVVMDADLQHDENAVIELARLIEDGADLAIGSREAEGGGYGDWSRWRRTVSWGGKVLAQRVVGTQVSDPMSGFFAISRTQFLATEGAVNPRGFKILLEFLARADQPSVREVGYQFKDRVHGATKMTTSVVGSYLIALLDLLVGRMVSSTFTAYALVGIMGTALRFGLASTLGAFGIASAGIIAFELSVLSNYWLNNRFTFAPAARRGWRFIGGLVPFHIIAMHGIVAQIGLLSLASELWRDVDRDTVFDGPLWLQAVGIAVATTGNYIGNRSITWRPTRSQ